MSLSLFDTLRDARRWLGWYTGRAMCAVASTVVAALVLPPLCWLAYLSMWGPRGLTVDHFANVFRDPATTEAITNTLIIAVSVSVGAALLGVPLAWLVSRTDMPLRRVIHALAVGSFVLPPFLAASAWILLGGPNAGLLNRLLMGVTGLQHGLNIFSLPGMTFVMILHSYPLVFLPVAAALYAVPADLEEVAQNMGARYARRSRDVTLPIVRPAVVVGMILAFFEAMSEYGTPAVIGTPAGVRVFTTELATYFQYPPMLAEAAALALPFLIAIFCIQGLQRWLLGDRGYAIVSGSSGSGRTARSSLGHWRWATCGLALLVPLFAVLLPSLMLAGAAFTKAWGLGFQRGNLTLANFHVLFSGSLGVADALKASVVLAAGSATLVIAITTLTAFGVKRRLVAGGRILGSLAMAPYSVPGIVFGVGLFAIYVRPPLMLYGTLWILLVAYVTRFLPIGYTVAGAALDQIHVDMEYVGRNLGASLLETLRDITLPLVTPSLLGGWILVFLLSLSEFSSSVLLVSANTQVAATAMYNLQATGNFETLSATGLLLIVIALGMFGILQYLSRRIKRWAY